MQSIRNSIDKFLDKFDHLISNTQLQTQQQQVNDKQADTRTANAIETKMPSLSVSQIETHKEFDPLANKKSLQSL